MVKSILSNSSYCKRDPKSKCHDFTDGTKTCGCAGGWSVFFATVNKRVGSGGETKPIPKHFNESLIIVEESENFAKQDRIAEHFIESVLMESDMGIPKWVPLAKRIIKSPKFNDKVKTYWKDRLEKWCKKNPETKICGE